MRNRMLLSRTWGIASHRETSGVRRGVHRDGAARPGFTLIEILIGIVVLALGLLGLAAVFPAVVVQQKAASDAVEGPAATLSAAAFLRGHERLNVAANTGPNAPVPGWVNLTRNTSLTDGWSVNGAWEVPGTPPTGGWRGFDFDPATGAVTIRQSPAVANSEAVVIPAAARLFPTPPVRPASGGVAGQPAIERSRFVWDFAARRVLASAALGTAAGSAPGAENPVQVAVFVRRVDAGIQISRGTNIVPVGADTDGRPTLNGRGAGSGAPVYSRVQRVEFVNGYAPFANTVNQFETDLVRWQEGGTINKPAMRPFVELVGQQLVDSRGTVATVKEVTTGATGQREIRLSTKLRVEDPAAGAGTLTALFTPQIPAAVEVFTIQP